MLASAQISHLTFQSWDRRPANPFLFSWSRRVPSGPIDNRTIELHTHIPTYIPIDINCPTKPTPIQTSSYKPAEALCDHHVQYLPLEPALSSPARWILPPPQRARCWLVCPGYEYSSAIATRQCIVPFPSWLGPGRGIASDGHRYLGFQSSSNCSAGPSTAYLPMRYDNEYLASACRRLGKTMVTIHPDGLDCGREAGHERRVDDRLGGWRKLCFAHSPPLG